MCRCLKCKPFASVFSLILIPLDPPFFLSVYLSDIFLFLFFALKTKTQANFIHPDKNLNRSLGPCPN